MKILLIHSDYIKYKPLEKALKYVEEVNKKEVEVKECLTVFTAVEDRDEVSPETVAENTVEEIKSVADQVKTKSIVLYPYVHLTSKPSKPATARKVMDFMEAGLKKADFKVFRAPFGYYKQFEIKCKGHPLSELSREITAQPRKKEEMKHTHGEPHAPKEEREHIRLGKELDVFFMDPENAPGFPFYPPNGVIVRNELANFLRKINAESGYKEVWTPHVFKTSMWEKSGHLEAYLDRMYIFEKDGDQYGLKPMNCPGHVEIFQRKPCSYKELPVKYSEFGTVYRYEQSGELTGILRVRALTQDDGHAFLRRDQIEEETKLLIKLVRRLLLDVFKFKKIRFALSTRGEGEGQKYIGDAGVWKEATEALRKAMKSEGIEFEEKPGEAAFYGPKIDVDILDSVGTWWQCSTIQLDFNLPERFGLEYTDENNKRQRPVMIHRALLGTLDRFLGILLEHFKDKFPPWLSPVQVKVLSITERQIDYAKSVAKELEGGGIRVESDFSNETLSKKIVNAHKDKTPYMIIIGEKEASQGKISVRDFNDKQKNGLSLSDFKARLLEEINKNAISPAFISS